MTDLMTKIVEARCNARAIGEYSEKELEKMCSLVILQASVVSGASIPSTTLVLDMLISEFGHFLKNYGYKLYTFEEIALAFRLNATGKTKFDIGVEADEVEYKGAYFNVAYAAKVLENYSKFRHLTDRKFQNHIDGYEA